MKRFSLAILGWLTILGSAQAGPLRGTEVPTKLLPSPVQVTPAPPPVVVYEPQLSPPAPVKKCVWREKVTVSYKPNQAYVLPPMMVNTCSKQVWIPGSYYESGGEQLQAIGYEEVCN